MEFLARLIGSIVIMPAIRDRLIAIAQRDPDDHIMSADKSQVYMYRYWLFNKITMAKEGESTVTGKRKYRFIPFSLRIHHIVMPDLDRHLHDHPFNARTWILKGGYDEVRLSEPLTLFDDRAMFEYTRLVGDTTTLGFDKYHRITKLHGGEAWTLFMFGRYLGPWGFMVNSRKMLRRDYAEKYQSDSPQRRADDNRLGAVRTDVN
jgi:hypothetical protein